MGQAIMAASTPVGRRFLKNRSETIAAPKTWVEVLKATAAWAYEPASKEREAINASSPLTS